ncbi:MAG: VOC family protein [Pseudanabaenaceae cyanobacterium bins.68]|nr:VOC family protein [Pseudanabaenaceae cyanobacterium bins.68]
MNIQYQHTAIRTADIWRAIEFYQALGFELGTRFTTGATLGCWLEGNGTQLELIQIPEPQPAPDCFFDQHYVGYYHLSFRVADLALSLQQLTTSLSKLRVLLKPTTQQIGDRDYLVAFIADPDGLPIELMQMISPDATA